MSRANRLRRESRRGSGLSRGCGSGGMEAVPSAVRGGDGGLTGALAGVIVKSMGSGRSGPQLGFPTLIAMRFVQLAAAFTPDGMPARMQRAQAAVDAWNVQQAAQRAAELQPPADDGTVLRDWFEKGRRLFTIGASWSVAGPALRVVDLASGEVAAYMPRFGMAPLAKAAIAMRLPATSASAGFCVDVAGPHDYALIELVRLADGMGLRAWRWRDRKWTQLQSARIRIDAWRLDGWFDLTIESGAAGIVAKSGELQLTVPKSLLGVGAGQFGLAANNGAKEPITIELRAFRLPQ